MLGNRWITRFYVLFREIIALEHFKYREFIFYTYIMPNKNDCKVVPIKESQITCYKFGISPVLAWQNPTACWFSYRRCSSRNPHSLIYVLLWQFIGVNQVLRVERFKVRRHSTPYFLSQASTLFFVFLLFLAPIRRLAVVSSYPSGFLELRIDSTTSSTLSGTQRNFRDWDWFIVFLAL